MKISEATSPKEKGGQRNLYISFFNDMQKQLEVQNS